MMIAADPVGSVYSGGSGEPYLVEGIGEDFWPGNWDAQIVDEVLQIEDDESFAWARRAARVEGLLLGGSCGAALAAAGRIAANARVGDVIVVVLPDGGRGYLSKLYNDTWMQSHGFPIDSTSQQGASVRSILDRVALRRPALVHTHPDETVGQVAAIMSEFGLHAVPVLSVESPRVPAQVIGSHTTREIAIRLSDPTHPAGPGERSLPLVGVDELCDEVGARFDERRAVLVVDRGSSRRRRLSRGPAPRSYAGLVARGAQRRC
jgi:cystathionine beta-synthase